MLPHGDPHRIRQPLPFELRTRTLARWSRPEQAEGDYGDAVGSSVGIGARVDHGCVDEVITETSAQPDKVPHVAIVGPDAEFRL